jgi:RHS repeat-associated protein
MFTGRHYDSEVGLYYYRARYYSPYLGRFLQTDPIRYSAGLNLYTYCRNNPLNFVDPLGLVYAEEGYLFNPRDVTYRYGGYFEVWSGGTRSWRNNNPGNIRAGDFANQQGAIGQAGGFAVFPDYQTGRAALGALLQTGVYSNLTISEAIEKYAPRPENDTEAYQKFVHEQAGVDLNELLKNLTPEERSRVMDAIQKMEGYRKGDKQCSYYGDAYGDPNA